LAKVADHQSMSTDTLAQRLPAPRITAAMLAAFVAPESVVVQEDDGSVYVLPEGLTTAQTEDPRYVVVLTADEAADYLAKASGRRGDAATAATAVLASRHARGLL
jgi:thiamine pyrophosphate-dependent acetolactate synthase large subunit-like protein